MKELQLQVDNSSGDPVFLVAGVVLAVVFAVYRLGLAWQRMQQLGWM